MEVAGDGLVTELSHRASILPPIHYNLLRELEHDHEQEHEQEQKQDQDKDQDQAQDQE